MIAKISRDEHRRRVRERVRSRISGSAERPRLNVFRSLEHIYAQLIDDSAGKTLVSASSVDKEVRKELKGGGNVAAAKVIGRILAERAKSKGFTAIVFDRAGYKYHGRVKALAEAAREAGLQF
jgi:large subunit ribosomal protein L18